MENANQPAQSQHFALLGFISPNAALKHQLDRLPAAATPSHSSVLHPLIEAEPLRFRCDGIRRRSRGSEKGRASVRNLDNLRRAMPRNFAGDSTAMGTILRGVSRSCQFGIVGVLRRGEKLIERAKDRGTFSSTLWLAGSRSRVRCARAAPLRALRVCLVPRAERSTKYSVPRVSSSPPRGAVGFGHVSPLLPPPPPYEGGGGSLRVELRTDDQVWTKARGIRAIARTPTPREQVRNPLHDALIPGPLPRGEGVT